MHQREVTFHSSDGYELRGELVAAAPVARPVTVVLQQGSICCDRNGDAPRTGFRSTLYRRIAQLLADRGVGSFRYDKRQFDRPAPEPLTYTLRERVADLAAAFNAILRQPEVDPDNLSILGHSEGGVVAQLAAIEVSPKRLAVLASPSTTLLTTMEWRMRRQRGAQTRMRQRTGELQLGALDEMRARLNAGQGFAPDEFEAFKDFHKSSGALQGWESWPWLAEHATLDIRQCVASIPCPVLYVHGERDRIVPFDDLTGYRDAIAASGRAGAIAESMDDLGHYLEDMSRKAFTVHERLMDRVARWFVDEQ